jgi:CheY-like chemotaxis protein
VQLARILVVDDEEPVRDLVSRILYQAGYTVLTAGDGPDALLGAELNPPIDLLIADLMMPQMYGDEVARQMRGRFPRLRVLYLTSHSSRLFTHRPLLPGREACLDKPFSADELLDATSLLLYGRGFYRPLP